MRQDAPLPVSEAGEQSGVLLRSEAEASQGAIWGPCPSPLEAADPRCKGSPLDAQEVCWVPVHSSQSPEPIHGCVGCTLRESWLDCNYGRFYFCTRLRLTCRSFESITVGQEGRCMLEAEPEWHWVSQGCASLGRTKGCLFSPAPTLSSTSASG